MLATMNLRELAETLHDHRDGILRNIDEECTEIAKILRQLDEHGVRWCAECQNLDGTGTTFAGLCECEDQP